MSVVKVMTGGRDVCVQPVALIPAEDRRLSWPVVSVVRGRDVCIQPVGDELTDAEQDQSAYDDVELGAAQMEWDPQTDVASPMLPIQGGLIHQFSRESSDQTSAIVSLLRLTDSHAVFRRALKTHF